MSRPAAERPSDRNIKGTLGSTRCSAKSGHDREQIKTVTELCLEADISRMAEVHSEVVFNFQVTLNLVSVCVCVCVPQKKFGRVLPGIRAWHGCLCARCYTVVDIKPTTSLAHRLHRCFEVSRRIDTIINLPQVFAPCSSASSRVATRMIRSRIRLVM